MSPEMQRKQHEVQKSFMEMKLNRKLANRPTRETLAEKNLLKGKPEKATTPLFFIYNFVVLFQDGDPELLKTKNTIQRKMIESKLNSQLSSKYSTRWSAGKGGEAAPLLTKWDRKREQSPNSPEVEQAAHASSFVPMPSSKDASPASKLQHNISSFSLLQKSSFIQQLQDEGRFVCINCCSEDFQGPELSSPRYSWDDFYNEEEWKLLGLEKPRHSEDAKKKKYVFLLFIYFKNVAHFSLPPPACATCALGCVPAAFPLARWAHAQTAARSSPSLAKSSGARPSTAGRARMRRSRDAVRPSFKSSTRTSTRPPRR